MVSPPVVYVARDGSGDYNAGATNADVQINQAIEYCYSHSGYNTVYLKAGTYVIRNPIKMRPGITLCGAGKYSAIVKLADNISTDLSSYFYITDAYKCDYGTMTGLIIPYGTSSNNTTYHDFQIDGNHNNNTRICRGKGYFNCIQMQYSSYITVYNMYMHDGHGDGLRAFAGTTGSVTDIRFYDNICERLGHDCLFVLRGRNVYAYGNTLRGRSNGGIRFNDVQNGYIYNNDIAGDANNVDSGPGIQLQRGYWATMTVEVYGNTIHDTFGCGMWVTKEIPNAVDDDGSVTKIHIHNNKFYNCATNHYVAYSAGIIVYALHNVRIENNTFVGCYGGGVVLMGIGYTSTSPFSGITTTIKNNIFMYNRLHKLSIDGSSTQPGTGWAVQNRLGATHNVICSYNCIYGNVSGTYTGVNQTEGNLFVDPQMAAVSITSGIANQDYHLKSKSGRYYNGGWVKDTVNSPCIDMGDPSYSYANEPDDNGDRINIGMYGNTAEASLSAEIISDSETLHDTRITNTNVDTSYHNSTYLDIGIDTNNICRSLLWFDLSEYRNVSIESATLSLLWYAPTSDRPVSTVIEVYRPKEWTVGQTTWNRRNSSTSWINKGGDWYDKNGEAQGAAPYGQLILPLNTYADKKYYNIDVTDLVKKYCNNTYTNTGFLLKASVELNYTHNKVMFYSSNAGTHIITPRLIVKTSTVIPTTEIIYITNTAGTGMFKCDGIDDHVQINQAIKLAKENPTLYSGVYLKGPFTYNISSPILVAGLLEGDSTAVVKLVNNANWAAEVPMFKQYATGLSGITIRGFKIDGNRAGNTNVVSGKMYYNLIHLSNCSNINIYNMNLTNNHGDGLKLTSCTNVNYYNNIIYLLGHDGIYAIYSDYVNAYNNTITCRTNSGLRAYNSNNVNFYDNDITSEGSGGAGIEIQKEGTTNMNNINIYNNKIYGTVLAGIWAFASSSYIANTGLINIKNNVIYGTGTKSSDPIAGGIVINGFNANIENNTIDGCYNSGIGIRETYSPSAVITGTVTINIRSNNITNTSGYGIKYTTLANHTIAQANNCIYNNSSGAYSNVTPPSAPLANITVDPLYADRSAHNYYLKSKAGRWNQATNKWVVDTVNSPCIDTGYAGSDYSNEPEPNGSRINIGAYGNTIHASYTGDTPVATNHSPVLAAITNKTVEIGDTLSFTVSATDEDIGDTLTYSMESVPTATGATLNDTTGAFSWTPDVDQEGTYSVTISVFDGTATDSKVIMIGVVKQEIYTISAGEIITNRLKEQAPTVVYNKQPYIDIGGRIISGSNKKYRDLVMVDLSEYMGKTITSALLYIYWFFPDGRERVNDTTVEVYRPLPWDTDHATWNSRTISNDWVSPGGDWIDAAETLNGEIPFASAVFGNDTLPDNAYHTLDVTSLVQAYVGGSLTNTGFLIKAQVEDDNYIAFYSQRCTLAGGVLKLIVQYTD